MVISKLMTTLGYQSAYATGGDLPGRLLWLDPGGAGGSANHPLLEGYSPLPLTGLLFVIGGIGAGLISGAGRKPGKLPGMVSRYRTGHPLADDGCQRETHHCHRGYP